MSLLAEASLLWNFRKHQKWQLHMSIIALDLELDVELDLQGVHYICSHPFHQEKKIRYLANGGTCKLLHIEQPQGHDPAVKHKIHMTHCFHGYFYSGNSLEIFVHDLP